MHPGAIGLALLGVMGACGDNLAGDPFTPRSGSRLKLGWWVYVDGARQVAPSSLTDVELGTACTVQRWSDGAAYCTPPAAGVVFTDAACSAPIFAIARDAAATAYLIESFTIAGVTSPSRLYHRGAELPPPATVYERTAGECLPAAAPSDYAFYERGPEVPRTALVRVKRGPPRGTGRLRVALDTSDDGLRVPAEIIDDELGTACVPEPARFDEATARCVPPAPGLVVYYRDAACAVPVLTVPAGAALPTLAMASDPATGCTTYAPLAEELGRPPLYRFAGAACVATSAPPDHRVFALAASLELGVLDRVPRAADGHRLWNVDAVHADARMPLDVMLDTAFATDCARGPAHGGLACLPWAQGAEPGGYYANATCSIPIDVALVPRGACDPRSPYLRYANGSETLVRLLGEPYRAPLYEISTADSCVAYSPPPRLVPHAVGPYLALDAFAPAVLIVDP